MNATATLAPVVHPKETIKPDFPAIVLTYTDALKALANNGGRLALGHVAAQTTRVISNLRRDSQKLRDAGVIRCEAEDWIITDKGRRWLLGQDVAAGVVEVGQGDAVQAVAEPPAGFVSLSAHDIAFDQDNARQTSGLSPVDIEEMAASIREHGLLTPPIVRDRGNDMIKWGLVAGERRLRGWRLAIERGWLPADTRYLCQIFDGDDTRATEAALVENLQRVDLDNLEAAEGLRRLSDQADPPATAAAIAKRLGKEERWVEQRLKVAREATAANKERYRAFLRRQAEPDFVPAADPDPFRWTDLRNSVQKPKHITALEKNPALAMLVVELAHRADSEFGMWDELVDCRPWPQHGLVQEAHHLNLVRAFPIGAAGHPRLGVSERGMEWLDDQGFRTLSERARLLAAVRLAALGPIAAAGLDLGQLGTDFLNPPEDTPNTNAAPTDNPDLSPTLRPGLTGDAFSLQLRSLAAEGEDGSEDGARSSSDPDTSPAGASPPDSGQGALAADEAAPEGPAPAADPPSPAAAGAGPDPLATLTPLARLALLELAHAVATRGATTRGGERGAPIFDFHADPTGAWPELFAGQRLRGGYVVVRQPANGAGWLGVLTEAGQAAVHTLAPRGVGRMYLAEHFEAAGLTDPYSAGAPLYATPWLNPPPTSEPGSPDPFPACREKVAPKGSDEGSTGPGQPATDPIIGGLRAAAADLWHAAREARAIFDDLFEREASTEQMDAAARSLQTAQFALAPYLTPEQKAAR